MAYNHNGSAINIFTDTGQNYIMSAVQPKLSAGTYYDAFDSFISLCDDCIDQAENGEPYDVNKMPDADTDGTSQDSQSKSTSALLVHLDCYRAVSGILVVLDQLQRVGVIMSRCGPHGRGAPR